MRKLKIAQLAPPWLRVPPKKYGGAELIVHHLTEGLVKRGHKVTLFASGNSKTQATLFSSFPKPLYWQGISRDHPPESLLQGIECFEKAGQFDIIHNHFYYWGVGLSRLTKTKVITTSHENLRSIKKGTGKYKIYNKTGNILFVSISNSQRKNLKGINLKFLKTIYNGIDVEKFGSRYEKGGYLAWLGRITRKKGVLEAIKIAKKADLPLKVAGKIDNTPDATAFYKKEIKPLIDGKQIKYIGEIGGYKEKSSFLKNAIALLNPISWEEPFGLVMAESMACGTPVIVFDRGSAREVVKDKETGFIVKNIPQAVGAVKKIDQIKRRDCRKRVEENFDKEKMIKEYEDLYYKILKKDA